MSASDISIQKRKTRSAGKGGNEARISIPPTEVSGLGPSWLGVSSGWL